MACIQGFPIKYTVIVITRTYACEEEAILGGSHTDYEGAIRKAADAMKPTDKIGLLFELLVPSYSPNYNERRASTFKKL